MKHPEQLIPGEEAFKSGEKASYMTYEAFEKMLRGANKGFIDQSIGDEEKGLKMLTKDGRILAQKLDEAADVAAKMWKYSKAHTNKEE